MKPELVKVTYELDRNDFFKLPWSGEEQNVSKESIKAAAEAVADQIPLTEMDLRIAAQVGVTREQLLEAKAEEPLDLDERRMLGTRTAIEVLASRIVR